MMNLSFFPLPSGASANMTALSVASYLFLYLVKGNVPFPVDTFINQLTLWTYCMVMLFFATLFLQRFETKIALPDWIKLFHLLLHKQHLCLVHAYGTF